MKHQTKLRAAQRAWLWGLGALLLSGCARGPNVGSDLPLRRVVVYRNGVGYFERAGKVDGERVTFKMRAKAVGDFLATLAIVERGGSSLRSASFPLDVEEPKPKEPPKPRPRGLLEPEPEPEPEPEDPATKLRDVVLHLDGREHDLSIGYVAETPVWRPSYRLVVGAGGKASLQTWGIVQNLSGEDWTDIELVLVAGAPIAFQSTLGEPVVPQRPIVTDTGEVIAAVPTGVTTLAEEAPEAEPEDAAEEPMIEGYASGGAGRRMGSTAADEDSAYEAKKAEARPAAPKRRPRPAPMARPGEPSAPRNLSALAAVAVQGGTTRYELPGAITVPNESATMVLLVNEQIPGEAVFLFSPDPGVPDSYAHPFRVARFTNATQGLLERGPIAVFEKGSFLGEGMLDPLPPKATATVPFALERGLAVQSERKSDQLGARLHKIEASQLVIQRDTVQKTIYTSRNGNAEPARLLIKHPRLHGARLHRPPEGTEDHVGEGHALVPLAVPARGKAEVTIDERTEFQQGADWFSSLADSAVRAFIADGSDAKVAAHLRSAWEIREKVVRARDERERLAGEQQELEKAARETRLSIKAIEKNRGAADLRQRLTQRLDDIGRRMDEITKRLVEVKMTEDEQEVRFRDAVRDIRWVRPAAGSVR